MNIMEKIFNRKKHTGPGKEQESYEYCPRCNANLTLQPGFGNDMPYWLCKGCGETLINPDIQSDVAWICDQCGAMLNIQNGFSEAFPEWLCTECGYKNIIDKNEIYYSEAEYKAASQSPYRGLTGEAVLALSDYKELYGIDYRDDVVVVERISDGKLFIRKILEIYDADIYKYLREHPIANMPQIIDLFEGENNLIVIEEYIQGKTLQEILKEGPMESDRAVDIVMGLCNITLKLHSLPKPIIHRDIKPSNIIITPKDSVYLLDMNAAKWYNEEKTEDTKLLGTQYFAAPEQLGYGFAASSGKSDIYALGILLNVMITGKLPKEEKASEEIWKIVEKCICLEPNDRYSDNELMEALGKCCNQAGSEQL